MRSNGFAEAGYATHSSPTTNDNLGFRCGGSNPCDRQADFAIVLPGFTITFNHFAIYSQCSWTWAPRQILHQMRHRGAHPVRSGLKCWGQVGGKDEAWNVEFPWGLKHLGGPVSLD